MKKHPKIVAATGKQIAELQKISDQGISDVNSICAVLFNAYKEKNDNAVYTIVTTEEKIGRLKKFIGQMHKLIELW